MPANTPCAAIPYPLPSDAPDVAGDMQRLATAVDTYLCNFNTKAVGELFHFYDTGKGYPAGALLCDGSTFNPGTYPALNLHLGGNQLPDLRGRFLMMFSGTFANNSRGGFTDTILVSHDHSGGAHTHGINHGHTASGTFSGTTGAQSNDHTHRYDHGHTASSAPAGGHAHGITGSGNTHLYGRFPGGDAYGLAGPGSSFHIWGGLIGAATDPVGDHAHGVTVNGTGVVSTGGISAGHTHNISGNASITVNNHTGSSGPAAFSSRTSTEGASGANRNLPPYHAVAILIQAV